ncbi:glycosyltransferase family 2 protein [Ectothiorhodospira shaposhnikovii]|uniref:glycosyltransferase family 2 protein n=1 Tax=Ectothiorhodospira shaposhnikovii TaxID=1054 RepID=UPI0039A21A13
MSNYGDVTVLISTFNRAQYLGECIESLLAQTVLPKQILIVNDGSTDATLSVLEKYKGKVEFYNQENAGKAVALNRVFSKASGKYVWIFDDDDVALPNFIEAHLRVMESGDSIDFTYSNYLRGVDGENGGIQVTGDAGIPCVDNNNFLIRLLEDCFLTTQGMLIRKDRIPGGYLFDEQLVRSQDYDLFIRLARFRTGFMVEGHSYIRRYHVGERGSMSDRFDINEIEMKWYKYEKIVVEKFVKDAKLCEYLPKDRFYGENESGYFYFALAQKAVILARKGLWDEFIYTVDCLGVLDKKNIENQRDAEDVCIKGFGKQLSVKELLNNDFLLRRVCEAIDNGFYDDARKAWARGLWYTYNNEVVVFTFREKLLVFYVLLRLLGIAGMMRQLKIF